MCVEFEGCQMANPLLERSDDHTSDRNVLMKLS